MNKEARDVIFLGVVMVAYGTLIQIAAQTRRLIGPNAEVRFLRGLQYGRSERARMIAEEMSDAGKR